MLLAQLSDLHVHRPGAVLAPDVDPSASARRAVERLHELRPTPHAVVLTGDLTENGTEDEFEHLSEILAPLEVPVVPVAGNHDERAGLRGAFPHLADRVEGDAWQLEVDLGEVRLVVLDTTLPGRHDGALDDERLGWLDDTLAAGPDVPTIVALHHPPFRTGIWWMDAGGLRAGGPELKDVIGRHPCVRRIICGHHHRTIVTSWGPTVLSVAPSTSHLVHLDLEEDSVPRFSREPAGFHVHLIDDGEIVTHTVGLDDPRSVPVGGPGGGEFIAALRDGRPLVKRS